MRLRATPATTLGLMAALVAGCSGSGNEAPGMQAPPFGGNLPGNMGGGTSQGNTPGDGSTPANTGQMPAGSGTTPAGSGTTPGSTEGSNQLPVAPGTGMQTDPMGGEDPDVPPSTDPPSLESVLVFTRTAGYRHDAIASGVDAIRALGSANGFAVVHTEEASAFNDAALAEHDVIIFLSTTGDVLDAEQQAAFERYIRGGGGWVGVHAASDTEYDWAWYGQLIGGGAYFRSHPVIQTAVVNVEQSTHTSTQHLPATFSIEDELYNFRANPRSQVTVLMTLDEASYSAGDGAMGSDHPISWYHEFDGGRAWYTGLGHRSELYRSDPDPARQLSFTLFSQHLLGGIQWAAGIGL